MACAAISWGMLFATIQLAVVHIYLVNSLHKLFIGYSRHLGYQLPERLGYQPQVSDFVLKALQLCALAFAVMESLGDCTAL